MKQKIKKAARIFSRLEFQFTRDSHFPSQVTVTLSFRELRNPGRNFTGQRQGDDLAGLQVKCGRLHHYFGSRMSQTATPPPTSAATMRIPTSRLEDEKLEGGISSKVAVGLAAGAVGDESGSAVGMDKIIGVGVTGTVGVEVAGAGWVAPRFTNNFCP